MDIVTSASAALSALPAVSVPQTDPFLFYSNTNSVRSIGARAVLSMAMTDPVFQTSVERLFLRELARGVENPVLVGAIPFDLNQPCHLIIPDLFSIEKPNGYDLTRFYDAHLAHTVTRHGFEPDHDEFIACVSQVLKRFDDSELKKVVLSRLMSLELDKPVDIERLMGRLIVQNPHAFHFNVPLTDGVLIGASPELLLRKQGHQVYSNPLAGSARRQSNPQDDAKAAELLRGSAKDQYEHALVVDSIQQTLSPYLKNDAIVPAQPELIHTPTMWHLSTRISGTVKDPNLSIFELIRAIHPTPAMGGTPTALAKQIIHHLEPYPRNYFSGLVGWCDSQGNGEWAIAIRCAHVSGSKVRLFAGAGIVPDSVPEKEWQETGDKMRTMLNAFGIDREAV